MNEIFFSIQGESLFAGRPCLFIRLTGCNLRCAYCDTAYAYDDGMSMEISEVLNRCASYRRNLVAITGGEPLIQPETPLLVERLLDDGYDVLMETNGSIDISRVDRRCTKIVDIKCPASNESHKNDMANLKRLGPADQVKFVIADRRDYEFAKQIINHHHPIINADHVLLSPAFDKIAPAVLAEWMLEDKLNARLNLQLHKILWPGHKRGK